MKKTQFTLLALCAILLAAFAGCAQYKITTPLEMPLSAEDNWRMGEIRDELPPDMEAEDKPEQHHFEMLADKIAQQIEKKKIFGVPASSLSGKLEVGGSIIEFKRGSGFLRFLVGFGAGNAVLTTELHVQETATGKVLFSGNFKGVVSSWGESGDKCFDAVAKNFAKALEKEQKKLLKK